MIISSALDLAPFSNDIDRLLIQCFNGLRLTESNPAALRAISCVNGHAISYAAAQPWLFHWTTDTAIATWMLGYVCTDALHRNADHASTCIGEIIAALPKAPWIVALNCRQELVPFYKQCGFFVIAPKASYDRNGNREIDADPVMVRCSHPTLGTCIIKQEVLHLGEEF